MRTEELRLALLAGIDQYKEYLLTPPTPPDIDQRVARLAAVRSTLQATTDDPATLMDLASDLRRMAGPDPSFEDEFDTLVDVAGALIDEMPEAGKSEMATPPPEDWD